VTGRVLCVRAGSGAREEGNLKGFIPPGIDEGVMWLESDGDSGGRFRRVQMGDLEI
jgi:hypothetical protein